MSRKQKWSTAIAAAAIAAVVVSMAIRHTATAPASVTRADAGAATAEMSNDDIVQALSDSNVSVDGLSVRNAGGIVILRGTADSDTALKAVAVVHKMGHQRVANLITPAATIDDEGIRRQAERQLAINNSLAGCTLRVACEKGVVRVTGTVQHELQKDAARSALRGVPGARRVDIDLALKPL